MKTRIFDFFTDCAKVITAPDELFYLKSQYKNYEGVLTSIFFTAFLGLILGIYLKDIIVTIGIIVCAIILVLLNNIIHSIITSIIARILGGTGNLLNLFNLISYTSVLDIFFIFVLSIFSFKPLIFIPIYILVSLWKLVINTLAVHSEYELGYGRSFLAAYGIIILIITILMGVL